METYVKGQLYNIALSDLHPDPNQPRRSMDPQALAELTESVKRSGILQPILFRQDTDGTLYIVVGERRHMAAQMADLLAIPSICAEGNTAEIALVENLQRQDLTCIEEAEALKRHMDEEKYTQEQLAAVMGKPRTTINDSLFLMRLPREIRDDCRDNRKISKTRLIEISRKTQQRAMNTAYAKYKEELQKEPTGGTKKREALSEAATLCQTLNKSREKLEKTDITGWSDDDRLIVNDSIGRLKDTIEIFISPPTEGGEAPPSNI
ncbi:MAG: ParB/RepB/Spo0J family partition protein [Proteobacteria bacterium]|nr:ParB/RepB/Spo0J family partition protein [Pseudomonadota bacterium]